MSVVQTFSLKKGALVFYHNVYGNCNSLEGIINLGLLTVTQLYRVKYIQEMPKIYVEG